jgi:transcriptional regulator with XRE-family HTH domain
MSRPQEPFDPKHSRCIYPEFGKRFSEVLISTGKTPIEIAKAVGVSAEIIRGYRRGFSRPSPPTQKLLEEFLGEPLDINTRNMPLEISRPGNITLTRGVSGDIKISIRISEEDVSKFLGKNILSGNPVEPDRAG